MNRPSAANALWSTRLAIDPEQMRRSNAGLRLNKWMDQENPDWKRVAGMRLDDSAYRLAYKRWEKQWPDNATTIMLKGRAAGRMLTGLGQENIHEAGLRLHHSYGTPLIPGSSIKGTLRARLHQEPKLQKFLFGTEDSSSYIRFQDAWWIPDMASPLAMDVITVHHPGYYNSPECPPPTDCDNPTPVPFLSVRGKFLFIAEFLGDANTAQWKKYISDLLKDTLSIDGIGAKRAAGYGRFEFGA